MTPNQAWKRVKFAQLELSLAEDEAVSAARGIPSRHIVWHVYTQYFPMDLDQVILGIEQVLIPECASRSGYASVVYELELFVLKLKTLYPREFVFDCPICVGSISS